jgi:hypothetical protein
MRAALGLVVLLSTSVMSQAGDASKKTVIDLNYDAVMDETHPIPSNGDTAHFHIQVVLSGKNNVSQEFRLSHGDKIDEQSTGGSLGQSSFSGVWHVASRNRLVHVWDMAQSVRTITVELNSDNTCTMHVTDRLKPGFREYAFQANWTNGLQYFSRYENVNESCRIQ